MRTLKIISSVEYYANTPSVFTQIDGTYYGCLNYPSFRNYPEISYWETAISSDSDRGFRIEEKEFSDAEISEIITLQTAINALAKLIPEQPKFELIEKNWKIKKGKEYQEWLVKETARTERISAYFKEVEVYDRARSKAFNQLRNILIK